MKNKPITKEFSLMLRRVSFASTLLKLAAVPVGLINARLVSDVVMSATAGDYVGVLQKGSLILLMLLGIKLFEIISQNAYLKAKEMAVHKCKMRLYRHYLSSPLYTLYQSSAGEANVILNQDFHTITEKIAEVYPTLIAGIVTVIAYFVFLCVQSPLIGCVLLFISVLQIVPPLISKRFFEKYDVSDKDMEKQVTDCALEFCNGFSTIKMLHLKEWCLQRLKDLHIKWWGIAIRLQATYRTKAALDSTISNILTYGTYAIVGVLILWGSAETDVGIEAIALSSGLYAAVNSVFQEITLFAVSKVAENRMMKFWSSPNSGKQMISSNTGIQFTNVTCEFGEKKLYDGLNLFIPLTGVVVFQGENGSGKSTLIKLALGMVECQKGDIWIGGVHPSQVSYDNFPRNLFYLPQEDAVYELTPSEMYQMLLDKEELERSFSILRNFGIQKEVCTRPIPNLSGGERKKVFLSLAFAMDPEVLILDEPTNSLDTKSCEVLYHLVKERSKGTVMITHDEGLMATGSKIYEIQKGGVCIEKRHEAADL